jgi:3-methyladenine DNA glycosylase AlkC
MAKKLKDYYDSACAELLAGKLQEFHEKFPSEDFVKSVSAGIEGKEFLARQDIFAENLEKMIGLSYRESLDLFEKILGEELQTCEGMFIYGWWLWPVGRFVQRNATKDFARSVDFIYEMTKRFTGEFAIRPLLEEFARETFAVLKKWSLDENVHVRRLASEGMRIKLPWAKKSMKALEFFAEFREILNNLKNAPEKFVQKSVGNNLNDLMKEDQKKAFEIIDSWQEKDPSKATLWIIKHGMRSLKRL